MKKLFFLEDVKVTCYITSPGSTNGTRRFTKVENGEGGMGGLSKVSNSFMYGKGSSLNVQSVIFFSFLFLESDVWNRVLQQ